MITAYMRTAFMMMIADQKYPASKRNGKTAGENGYGVR